MNDNFAIQARGLTKRFGHLEAVSHLDLDVPRGRIYGFLGPNGSGKSTTLRMLCGLLTPSEGTARVLDTTVPGNTQALKPRIGYMTQKFSLFADMTCEENLQFISEIYSVPAAERRPRIDELLERYDLKEQRKQLAGTMSGGQKQRLALACAVLHKPELLLLDEPTSAVDPQSRRDFWSNLFRLADAGTTIMVSTHYMDEAERCHRLAILDRGQKAADGTPKDLLSGIRMHVIEIESPDTAAAQAAIQPVQDVKSLTQLGARLRVLLPDTVAEPLDTLRKVLDSKGIEASVHAVAPSLEDVFVTVTMKDTGDGK
ncbi:MAG: ABC transporter ATP-binding protein [Woeseiaceae bacterium]|nr:ABC transporter ATP-binding protein [Woeseiaceae bacterium]